MIITTDTLFAIRQRMEIVALPLLFYDVQTPSTQVRRVVRIMTWMGAEGQSATTTLLREEWYRRHVANCRSWVPKWRISTF